MFVINGCQKDNLTYSDVQENAFKNERNFKEIKLNEVPHVWEFIKKSFKDSRNVKESRNAFFSESDIDTSSIFMRDWGGGHITYNFLLPTKENTKYNLILEEQESLITNIKVLGSKYIVQDIVELAVYPFNDAFGGSSARDISLIECYKILFSINPVRPIWRNPFDPAINSGGDPTGSTGGNTGGNNNPFNGYNSEVIINIISGGSNGSGNSGGTSGTTGGTTGSGGNTGNDGRGGSGSGGSNNGGGGGIFCRSGACPNGYDPVRIKFVSFDGRLYEVCFCVPPHMTLTNNGLPPECRKKLLAIGFIDRGQTIIPDNADEMLNQCNSENPAISQMINAAANGAIINPCTGDVFHFNPYQLAVELCAKGNYSPEGFSKWLEDNIGGTSYYIDRSTGIRIPPTNYEKMIDKLTSYKKSTPGSNQKLEFTKKLLQNICYISPDIDSELVSALSEDNLNGLFAIENYFSPEGLNYDQIMFLLNNTNEITRISNHIHNYAGASEESKLIAIKAYLNLCLNDEEFFTFA